MSNLKKLIFVLIVFLILVVYSFSSNLSKGNKFQGTVQSVKDNSVVVFGAYETEIAQKKNLYDFSINVPSDIKITKTTFFPPIANVEFKPREAPRSESVVDFATLKKDSNNVPIGIEVILSSGIVSKFIPKAVEIKYIAPRY